jgi:hypothetical protein
VLTSCFLCCAVLQESSFSQLSLVELKNHEEQLQEDPTAKLTKVRSWRGEGGWGCSVYLGVWLDQCCIGWSKTGGVVSSIAVTVLDQCMWTNRLP